MINIEQLTIAEARSIAALFNAGNIPHQNSHPYEIGKYYMIRTVTMIDTGKVVAVTDNEIVLEEAAWIADTSRFSDAVKNAEFGEVEPFPEGQVIVGRGSIIDAVIIKKSPRSQK